MVPFLTSYVYVKVDLNARKKTNIAVNQSLDAMAAFIFFLLLNYTNKFLVDGNRNIFVSLSLSAH